MNARRALMLVLAVGIGLFVVRPALAGPWSLKPGEYATDLSGGSVSTTTYADENGNDQRLYGGGTQQRRSANWLSEFGWKKTTSFIIGIPFVSVTRAPADAAMEPTTTVMGDAVLGLKRSFKNGPSAMALEIDAVLPMGYQRKLALSHEDSLAATRPDGSFDWNVARSLSTPRAGDGQASIGGTMQFGTALGSAGFVSGYAGYAYRGPEWQGTLLTGADVAVWLGKAWLLGARYRGVTAGEGDEITRDQSMSTLAPVVTYRIDDHIDVYGSVSHVLSAKNTAYGDEVRIGFTFKQTKLNRLQGYLGSAQRP